MRTENMFIGS